MAAKEETNDATTDYLANLRAEYDSMDASFTQGRKMLEKEIQRVKSGGAPDEAKKFIEAHKMTPVKVFVNIIIPSKEHPQVNFIGKLLGPGGNSLKQLQMETQTRMVIQGKGSMRDKKKEEELRTEGGKYDHLNEPLHLCVQAFAPAAEAYSRIANALRVLQPYLRPDTAGPMGQEPPVRGRGEVGPNGDAIRARRPAMGEQVARGGLPPRRAAEEYGYAREPAPVRAAAYDDYGVTDLRARDPYAPTARPAPRDPYDALPREPRAAVPRDAYYDGYGTSAAETARDRYAAADYDAPPARGSWPPAAAGNGYGKAPPGRGGRGGVDRAHPYSRGGRAAPY